MHDDQIYPKTTLTTTNQHLDGNWTCLTFFLTQSTAERLYKLIYSRSLSPPRQKGRWGREEADGGTWYPHADAQIFARTHALPSYFKNTAFIKDILSGALEVPKFEGANVWTVSGIRGGIRKPYKTRWCIYSCIWRWSTQKRLVISLSHTLKKKTNKLNLLPLDIIFLRVWYSINTANSTIHLLLSPNLNGPECD